VENYTTQAEVSTIHIELKQDLVKIQDALATQFANIHATMSTMLENTAKTLVDTRDIKEATKDITSRVGMVNNAADKIASTTQSYRDILTQNPITAGKNDLDPKIQGDMKCKARQILVDIHDEDDNKVLSKSMTEVTAEANDSLDKVTDTEKPEKVKVESALWTRKGALVLTLCSKEAANWIRQPTNKIAFTEAFSKGSHIRERTYNLIVPRVPITFDLENKTHIREIEEANVLREYTIRKARWIKPIERRRAGQMHTFAILTITSADYANILIRDRLIICGTRIRPTKQKLEPIQCMKCRRWGHFAGECPAEEDICGTCRGKHQTSGCQNKEKRWCVTCENANHASWDRNCPEFNRRCFLVDEKNPENGLTYFPTEQDWTQTSRPSQLAMDEQFPGKYAVNSLPIYSNRQVDAGPQGPQGKGKNLQPRSGPKRRNRTTERADCSYPNTIPLDRNSRQNIDKPDEDEVNDPLERLEEIDEIEEILASIHANDSKYTLRTDNQF
jgi:hypothetical protein